MTEMTAIEAAGVRPDARAEQLEVADFVRLANSLEITGLADDPDDIP